MNIFVDDCNTLQQLTATHCNILQHTETHYANWTKISAVLLLSSINIFFEIDTHIRCAEMKIFVELFCRDTGLFVQRVCCSVLQCVAVCCSVSSRYRIMRVERYRAILAEILEIFVEFIGKDTGVRLFCKNIGLFRRCTDSTNCRLLWREKTCNKGVFDAMSAPMCSALQHTATQQQYTATHCNTLQHIATHCNTLQRADLVCCDKPTRKTNQHERQTNTKDKPTRNIKRTCQDNLRHKCCVLPASQVLCVACVTSAVCCMRHKCARIQHTAAHCNTLPHSATHYKTLQH